VNVNVVTEDRTQLSERAINGIRMVKDAITFFDPKDNKPQNIPFTHPLSSIQIHPSNNDQFSGLLMAMVDNYHAYSISIHQLLVQHQWWAQVACIIAVYV
jgi:hypothetical protein